MSIQIQKTTDPEPMWHSSETRRKPAGPVIVASDGSDSGESIFSAAKVSAQALSSSVQVLGICEPAPGTPFMGGSAVAAPDLDNSRRRMMLDDVRRSVSVSSSADPEWLVEVILGSPPDTLAAEAERRGASLMVMGLGRQNPLDRLLGAENTLATLRNIRVPVLAVGKTPYSRPRKAIVGMDFSPASVRAARLALRLLTENGSLTLVHVRPSFDHPSEAWQQWDQEYGRSLAPLFAETVAQLDAASSVELKTVTIRGEPGTSLLSYAQQANADLLAIGTQRNGVLDRLLVGSVATRIIRNTRLATLAAPAPLVAGPAGLAPEGARVESSTDPAAWSAMLYDVTRRNAGRKSLLEIGPEATALKPVAADSVFMAANADIDRLNVCITLSHANTQLPIDHKDAEVQRIAIVRDAEGTDLGLRLRHSKGVTRLSFH